MLRSESCPLLIVSKRNTAMYGEKSLQASHPRSCEICWPIILNLQQVKKYIVKFLKSTYFKQPIYNMYPPAYLCITYACAM